MDFESAAAAAGPIMQNSGIQAGKPMKKLHLHAAALQLLLILIYKEIRMSQNGMSSSWIKSMDC